MSRLVVMDRSGFIFVLTLLATFDKNRIQLNRNDAPKRDNPRLVKLICGRDIVDENID